jgi:hypothetical protein
MNMNRTSSNTNRYRLIAMAVFVAAVITACPNPDQMMDARINDFLGDLAQLDGTADDDARVESIVSTHLHPEAQSGDQATAAFWINSVFDADNAESYTWSFSSSTEVTDFEGSTRRSGTVALTRSSGDTTNLTDIRFFMKQSGMDWRIRAIADGGDGNLFQNIR